MKKTTTKKSLPKAQLGNIVKGIAKAISTGAKVADKVSDVKKVTKVVKPKVVSKELSVFQKERAAAGKPVYRGSNPNGNMTVQEIKAKKDLQKNIKNRKAPKKLTKEEQYLKDIEDSYRQKGGAIKSKKK